jgi:hypothetical protein
MTGLRPYLYLLTYDRGIGASARVCDEVFVRGPRSIQN